MVYAHDYLVTQLHISSIRTQTVNSAPQPSTLVALEKTKALPMQHGDLWMWQQPAKWCRHNTAAGKVNAIPAMQIKDQVKSSKCRIVRAYASTVLRIFQLDAALHGAAANQSILPAAVCSKQVSINPMHRDCQLLPEVLH